MLISNVLRVKGDQVVTVSPDADVRSLLGLLAEHGIGAAVVSRSGATVEGIVSERDVVRALAKRGTDVLSEPVSAVLTSDVQTVTPDAHIDEVMVIMTERRIRHLPVLRDGVLSGIVSIGDLVKSRIGELESERDSLTDYISTAR